MANISTFVGGAGGLVGGECITCAGNIYCMTSDNQSAVAICFNQTGCLYLPDATTIDPGAAKYTIKNINDSRNIIVYNNAAEALNILTPCQSLQLSLYDNSTCNGKWIHEKPTTNATGVGVAQTLDIVSSDYDLFCITQIDDNITIIYGYDCTTCVFTSSIGKFNPSTEAYSFSTPACVTTCAAIQVAGTHKFFGTCSEDDYAVWVSNRSGPQIVINKTGGLCVCCLTTSCTQCWGSYGWGQRVDNIDRFYQINPICGVTSLCYELSFGRIDLTSGVMCVYDQKTICDCGMTNISNAYIEDLDNFTELCHFQGTVMCRINVLKVVPGSRASQTAPSCNCGEITNPYITVRVPALNGNCDDYCMSNCTFALGMTCCSCYQIFNNCLCSQCIRSTREMSFAFPGTACCFLFTGTVCKYDCGAQIMCCATNSTHVNGSTGSNLQSITFYCSAQPAACTRCRGQTFWPISENYYFYNIQTTTDTDVCLMYSASFNGSQTNCGTFSVRCNTTVGCCGAEERSSFFNGHVNNAFYKQTNANCGWENRFCNTKFHDPSSTLIVKQYQPSRIDCGSPSGRFFVSGASSWQKRTAANCGCLVIPFDANPVCNCVTYCVYCFNGASLSQSAVTVPCNFSSPWCVEYFRVNAGKYEYFSMKCGNVGCFCNNTLLCNKTLDYCSSGTQYIPLDENHLYIFNRTCGDCVAYCVCRDVNCDLIPCGVTVGPSVCFGAATGVSINCSKVTPVSSRCGSSIAYQNACNAFLPVASTMTFNCSTLQFENKNCFDLDTIPIPQGFSNMNADAGGYILTNTVTCNRAFSFLTINA